MSPIADPVNGSKWDSSVPDWDIFRPPGEIDFCFYCPESLCYQRFLKTPPVLASFMHELGIWKEGEVVKNKQLAAEVFRYVLQVPEEDFAHLTIKMLAERFDVSRCHISRTFRIERKMTLATFIHRQRLLRAERQLLRDQDLTVKALASSLGYADYQYFIARFKEHWGESPGRYRKIVGDFAE
jgi:AraC-like DNA-binding protein